MDKSAKTFDQTLNNVYTEGEIIFYPNDFTKYASLKRFREKDGGVNLTALNKTQKLGSHLEGDVLQMQKNMLNEIFGLVHEHGGLPMHNMISEARQQVGFGKPQVTTNFGGTPIKEDTAPEVFSKFVQKVTELVEQKLPIA